MYYNVIKHSGHLGTLEKCRKHSPPARVFYISLVFSNAHRVLSQSNTRLRLFYLLNKRLIKKDHYTVVCSVTWPSNGSEAGGDLALIQTSLPLSRINALRKVNIRTTLFTQQNQRDLYKNKVTSSLDVIRRPGH